MRLQLRFHCKQLAIVWFMHECEPGRIDSYHHTHTPEQRAVKLKSDDIRMGKLFKQFGLLPDT